tara:strand:- start:1911 stop:2498 length:588 start_codon:yes stop_codon:yes gene_type:complete
MPSNSFKKYQIDSINIIRKLAKFEKQLDNISLIISKKIKNGGKILTCGNGGSSCDAQHLVAELVVRLKAENDRKSIPALFLGMDLATMTACGNDFGYDKIFSRTLDGIGDKNDILISYSTSGKSKNILNALKKAKEKKIYTVSFLGNGGGLAKNISENNIIIPSNNVMRIQESHLFLSHYLAEQIEKKLFTSKKK